MISSRGTLRRPHDIFLDDEVPYEFDAMYALWKSGLAVNSLISHRFSFDDVAEAYCLFAAGKTAKVLLKYE